MSQTAFSDINKAFAAHLNANKGTLGVAWENDKFDKSKSSGFVEEKLVPLPTFAAAVGEIGIDNHEGSYELIINTPRGKGRKQALEMSDIIANAFKRGTVITENSINIRLTTVYRLASEPNGAWYETPVIVEYQCFTQPR